jgi:uncharacterized repeat protein (TIGR01451 family)
MKTLFAFLAAAAALGLGAASAPASGHWRLVATAQSSPASSLKKRCKIVVKRIHGKKRKVRVCHTVKQPHPRPPSADLSVTTSASTSSVQVGGSVTYTLRILNRGPARASGVVVTDILPAGAAFESASASQGTCSGTMTVICRLGALAKGGRATVKITVKATVAGVLNNGASVSSATRDRVGANNHSLVVAVTVTAPPAALGVVKSGTGTGTVTSSPGGISCGSTCSASFGQGSSVTLTASAGPGSTFAGWGGACTGTGSCILIMSGPRSVTAAFNLELPTLTVTKAGSGTGTVTSSPGGISCGSVCAASFPTGTAVTLTAAPASGSSFTGWSGACAGASTCTVTVDAAKSVTATFAASPVGYPLSVSKSGSGSGTVTSSPAGISCGYDCGENYAAGTSVTLTATAASGSSFDGWSGACSGTGLCTVTMDAARSVTATFNTSSGGNCAASYPTVCIPPPPPDLDCNQVPYRNFTVLWNVPNPDPHHFDGDHDGIGCET